jgi:hypothetical protein
MANKISTKSYCVKRLKDCGYNIDKLDSLVYQEGDQRKWTIIVDDGGSSIILTLLKNNSLHFYDGNRYFNSKLTLNTDSVEVLIEFLNERGIVNKHPSYGTRKEILEKAEGEE